ncbi:MAG: glutathione S-transferase, partial [Pacificimonas sp.]
SDPTPMAMLRADFPYVYRWLEHVADMSGVDGEWNSGELSAGVSGLLDVIGAVYLPFLAANALAIEEGTNEVRFSAKGHDYVQAPFRYQAKCFAQLRQAHADLPTDAKARIEPTLAASGCLQYLTGDTK